MNSNHPKIFDPGRWLMIAALMAAVPVLHAADLKWTNTANGAWEAAANWSPNQAPTNTDSVFITNTAVTVSLTNDSSSAWLTVGNLTISGPNAGGGAILAMQITNTFTVLTNATVGTGSSRTGYWNIDGGTAQIGATLAIGDSSSTKGEVTVANANTLLTSTTIQVGARSRGFLTVSNGAEVRANNLVVGWTTGGDGQLVIDNGTVKITNKLTVSQNFNGQGSVVIGGNGVLQADSIYLAEAANNSGGYGEIIQSNGWVQTAKLYVGSAGDGTSQAVYRLLSGTLTNSGATYIGSSSGGRGQMVQSGGFAQQVSLTVGTSGGSSGSFQLLGGTNIVTGASNSYLSIGANSNSSGTVTVNGGELYATNISGYLAIGKQGAGTLILSNGIVMTDKQEFVGHEGGGNGKLYIYGGTNIAAGIGIAPFYTNNTGYVEVAGSGVLRLTAANVNIGGSGGAGTLLIRDGGLLQFEVNPSLSRGANSTFAVTNATIAYQGVTNADVATLLSRLTSIEANSRLRLDSSTNASGLGTLNIGGAGNFTTLELTGDDSRFQSSMLAIAAGGKLDVVQGSATVASTTVNNAGTITVSNATTTFTGAISGTGTFEQAGASTTTLTASNTFTGKTTVAGGALKLDSSTGSALGGTSEISVTNGAALLISQSDQVNDAAAITLSGGTITRGAAVSETMGNLTVGTASFLDYGTGATGALQFGTYTPSALLTVSHFLEGNKLVFASDLTFDINNGSLFAFDNDFSYKWESGLFTITAIPEPSAYVAAAGLLGLMLWPGRRRLFKDARSFLGLRRPARERLAKR